MHAMILKKLKTPLEWMELPDREPGPHEIRVKVLACGVCRTDLHVVDGELPNPKIPIIPGHEIVGRIDAMGTEVKGMGLGERVGIPWLGHTARTCAINHSSRASHATGAMRRQPSPMRVSHSPWARWAATSRSRRCSARDSSAGAHS